MGSGQHSTRARSLARCVVALIALLVAGCRRDGEQQPELEAVDVGPALEIETAGDQKAVERPPELVGILPEDFPRDLPLYLPASLVDFGSADDGWIYVNLLTPHALAKVEGALTGRLRQRGWTIAGRQLRKGDRRARLAIEDARPGTQYRYEYPP